MELSLPKKDVNALMVFPSFSPNSFWNYRETCAVAGRKYSAAPLGMITVAALLPAQWSVRLIDRNIEELRDEDISWADLVMIGSMLPQHADTKQVIELAHASGKPVVLGGPDVTCSPSLYEDVEFRLLGEVEEIITDFLEAWDRGDRRGYFEALTYPDIQDSPLPRFDLLKLQHYMHVGVQFSRGCPFNCEFCNVIELNGRIPRFKTNEQMLRELDALHELGYRGHVDVVDDNLIGIPKAAKTFLEALRDWNEQKGHPFVFSAEASLNLADRDDLLDLMRQCGFFAIFVGIETPDTRALLSVKKRQNTGRDMAQSIHKIYEAGIFVNAGFIIGLDAERESVAQAMIECIEEMAIPVCMVGLLYALPDTQLSSRLLEEGRLFEFENAAIGEADQCTSGLNFETLRPRAAILEDYREVLGTIYHPVDFFGRVRRLARALNPQPERLLNVLPHLGRDLRSFARICWRLGVRNREVRRSYWGTLADCVLHNPGALNTVVSFSALYLHFGPFAASMDDRLQKQIAAIPSTDKGRPLPSAREMQA